MKKLLNAQYHTLTKRWFGPDQTPSLEGRFGPYSLKSHRDRQNLRLIADRITSELHREA